MKIFVLGHRGMLGHVVARHLSACGHEIATTAARFAGTPGDPLIAALHASECRWIVNAIGRIPQKSTEPGELLLANAQLPAMLRRHLRPDQRVIHASSDCVFSGRRGHYRLDEPHDATDAYGRSKSLGESAVAPDRFIAIRTSIVGPEIAGGAHGLMGWFLSQRGAVRGFTNHFWNGITTLEWAKLCAALIAGRLSAAAGLVQPGVAAPLSKCDLLRTIAETWRHPVKIVPTECAERVDRSLVPDPVCPPIAEQLRELRNWYD